MLDIQQCSLVIVDVQGRLAQLMYDRNALFKNIQILIKAAKILKIPIIWCEQQPESIGVTVRQLANLLTDNQPIKKASFSCCAAEQFNSRLKSLARRQVLLCGLETHVCIYQTAADLSRNGYYVEVIADAVSSRILQNRNIAIKRMGKMGINISSAEMALFELLKTAEHPQFKKIIELIK